MWVPPGIQSFKNCSSVDPCPRLQKTCLCVVSAWVEASFRTCLPAPEWEFSMDCRGTACFTMVFCRACRAISALVSGAPPPIPSLTGVLLLFPSPLSLRHFAFSYMCFPGAPPPLCPRSLAAPRTGVLELSTSVQPRPFLILDALGCVGCLKSYCQITWKKPKISNYLWYVKPLFGKSYRFPAGAF